VVGAPTARSMSSFWDELVACGNDANLLIDVVARRAAEVVGEASILTRCSDDGKQLVPVAVHHRDTQIAEFIRTVVESAPYGIDEGLAGRAVLSREAVVVSEVDAETLTDMHATHTASFRARHTIHALLIVPMIAFGEVLGTLGVVRIESNQPYDDEDRVVMESLAERAALVLADATRRPARVGPAEYEAIFRQSMDGVLLTVPDGRVLAANPAACEILQRSEVEICRLGRAGLLVVDDPTTKSAISQRAVSGAARAELPMIRGDGETFTAEMSSTIFTTEYGQLRAAVIFRDVTSRVRAQEQLAIQHEYLQLLHAATTAINQATSIDSAIEHALRAVGTATDWPLGDALLLTGDGLLEPASAWFISDDDEFRWFRHEMQRAVLLPGEGLPGNVVESATAAWVPDLANDKRFVRGPQLEHVPLRAYVGVPIMAGSDVRGVLEFFSDQPKPRDDRLLALMIDLGTQLGRILERAETEAAHRRLDEDRASFVERAAHELRSPVSSLVIAADLLAKQPPADERGQKLLDLVVDSAHHLARLVNRLLDLSQLERSAPRLEIKHVDIGRIVERALEVEPAPPGHTVTCDVPAGLSALADELAVEQILTNLLRNAYRYGGTHVDVGVRRQDDRVLLIVTDDGAGVDPTIEDSLFEPFVRGPGHGGDGAGLGLAVSHRLTKAMDGTLSYRRAESGGSRFSVDLPAA
jgi:PAS domain S-box-containing protein